MREFLQLSVRLLVFTLIAGLLLGATNAITEGPISEQKRLRESASRYKVFPEADSFEQLADIAALKARYPDLTAVYKALKGSEHVGYTGLGYTINCTPNGYKGPISLTVGASKAGAITGVAVDSQSETQGVGSKITSEEFLSQFTGRACSEAEIMRRTDTISGATISSGTVKRAVQMAARLAENELGIAPHEAKPLSPDDEYRLATLPDAKGFESINPISLLGDYGSIRGVKAAYSGSEIIGYSFDLAVSEGESAAINLTLGISAPDGRITGIKAVSDSAALPSEPLKRFDGMHTDDPAILNADGVPENVTAAVNQAASFYETFLRRAPESLDAADRCSDITSRMQGREADYAFIKQVEEFTYRGELLGYRFTLSVYDGAAPENAVDIQMDAVRGRITDIILPDPMPEGSPVSAANFKLFRGVSLMSHDELALRLPASGLEADAVLQCASFYEAYISGEEAAA